MKTGVLIIDDELNALETIESIIEFNSSEFEILAKTTNPYEAIGLISHYKPDIVFLDIEMPGLSGFELLNKLSEISFEVIFTTAYEQYAIQAIKNNALDYILKPVSVSEVNHALEKVSEKLALKNKPTDYQRLIDDINTAREGKIRITTQSGFDLISLKNIIYLKANGVYTNIKMSNGEEHLVTKPLQEILEKLDDKRFCRTHRSFIVNLKQVLRYDSDKNNIILSDASAVPLARRRKGKFLELIEQIC